MGLKTKTAVRQLCELKKYDDNLRLAAEWKEKWKVLISTILSSQTKDETTIKVSEILYKKYPTLKKFAAANLREVRKIIKPINYYKTKSKNIFKTSKIIFKKGIPETIEGLLELPGVGRKVANVYLAEALKADAIGVDTHVARLSRKLNWTKEKNPHKIEKDLEKLFPKKFWNSINYILVRFGRNYRKTEDEIIKKIKYKTL